MHEPAISDRALINVGRVSSRLVRASEQRVLVAAPSNVDTWEKLNALDVTDIIIFPLVIVGVENHGFFGKRGV